MKKKTFNANLDEDLVTFLRERFPGNGSKVINHLTREFKQQVEANKTERIAEIVSGKAPTDIPTGQ